MVANSQFNLITIYNSHPRKRSIKIDMINFFRASSSPNSSPTSPSIKTGQTIDSYIINLRVNVSTSCAQ